MKLCEIKESSGGFGIYQIDQWVNIDESRSEWLEATKKEGELYNIMSDDCPDRLKISGRIQNEPDLVYAFVDSFGNEYFYGIED